MKNFVFIFISFLLIISVSHAFPNEQHKITAFDAANLAQFAHDVAFDGVTILAGAPYDDANSLVDSGSVYVYTFDGSSWNFQQKLTPTDAQPSDLFGWSVALDGDTALIGGHYSDGNATNSGSAYVFTRSGTTWTQQAELFPNDGQTNDIFGYTVALENDTALIGSTDAGNNTNDGGRAYVYDRSGSVWSLTQTLAPNDKNNNNDFGRNVALDGDNLVIGALLAEGNATDSGAAYVFTRSGTTWTQQGKLIANDGATNDQFGIAVDISNDSVFVGASADDDLGVNAGSAYVFIRSGTTWTQQQELHSGIIDERFGAEVVIENTTAIVGSRFGNSGHGYVFSYNNSTSTWDYVETFSASDANGRDIRLGGAASLQGNTVVFGAQYGDVYSGGSVSIPYAGASYIFEIGTNTNCFIDAPASVNENASFMASVTCDDTIGVYGFEYDQSVDPSSPTITPQGITFTEGNIFAGKSTFTLINDVNSGFAQSLVAPEIAVSGDFTLGSLTYDTDDPGIATLNLDNLILGDINGQPISANVLGSSQISILDIPLASISGTIRRETGVDVTSAITILTDGVLPDSTGTAGGFFTFEYDEETVALDASLTVNAPGHVSCLTSDLGLIDDTVNILTAITLLAGDVDNNDTVDITDGSIIVQERFLPGSAPVGTTPDLNEDTFINVLDIIHVGRNFSTVGPSACQ